jgi:hypothetical protein
MEVAHCCHWMEKFLQDSKVPLEYYPIAREYGIKLRGSSAIQLFDYCPWCGSKLPGSLRDEFFNILKVEYGVYTDFDIKADPKISQEFKSDEWWKKRGL